MAGDLDLSDVSRETIERLQILVDLLARWTQRINLVSKGSLKQVWKRHVLDSKQIFDLNRQYNGVWADLGTGGGFPGLVIAILAAEMTPSMTVVLVESDVRKATFLRRVGHETGINPQVICERIEDISPIGAGVVSARAVAPLPALLGYVDRHMAPGGRAFLPKGESWEKEVALARETWKFRCEAHASVTSRDGVILQLDEITHA